MKISIINGVNLNFTGVREKSVYGSESLSEINAFISDKVAPLNIDIDFFQSNHEGAIVDYIQSLYGNAQGIVINPGAFTHYSYAIRDALASFDIKTIEVHLSNLHKREEFRHVSVIAPSCAGQICGLGKWGYVYAIYALIELCKI